MPRCLRALRPARDVRDGEGRRIRRDHGLVAHDRLEIPLPAASRELLQKTASITRSAREAGPIRSTGDARDRALASRRSTTPLRPASSVSVRTVPSPRATAASSMSRRRTLIRHCRALRDTRAHEPGADDRDALGTADFGRAPNAARRWRRRGRTPDEVALRPDRGESRTHRPRPPIQPRCHASDRTPSRRSRGKAWVVAARVLRRDRGQCAARSSGRGRARRRAVDRRTPALEPPLAAGPRPCRGAGVPARGVCTTSSTSPGTSARRAQRGGARSGSDERSHQPDERGS